MRWIAVLLLFLLRVTPSEAQLDQSAERSRERDTLMREAATSYALGDLVAARRAFEHAQKVEEDAEAHLGLAQVACAEHNYGRCETEARAALHDTVHPLDEAGRSRADWLIAETSRVSSLVAPHSASLPEPHGEIERGWAGQNREGDALLPRRLLWVGASLLLVAALTAGLMISADSALGQ